MSVKIIKSYRGLMRATSLAFKNDVEALRAARDRIRSEYAVPLEEGTLNKRVQFAKNCAHILRTNVVQGVQVPERSTPEKPVYNLQLHKESELGDNDSRFGKPVANGAAGAAEGCCGAKNTN